MYYDNSTIHLTDDVIFVKDQLNENTEIINVSQLQIIKIRPP